MVKGEIQVGCDIHSRVEVMTERGWELVGEVFPYPYGGKYFLFTEKLAAGLSDGRLLFSAHLHFFDRVLLRKGDGDPLGLTNKYTWEPNMQRTERLSSEATKCLVDYREKAVALNAELDEEHEKYREENRKSGKWDGREYTEIRARMKREHMDSIEIRDEVRREIVDALLEFRYERSDESEREDDLKYHIFLEKQEDETFYTDQPVMGRDYTLFAALADVRNNYGFGGVDMGDRIEPLDSPRGVPYDVSIEGEEFMEMYGEDGHSHSYMTVRELIEWEGWNQTVTNRGVVTREVYEDWHSGGDAPTEYSGGVSGPNVVVVPWWDYDEYLQRRKYVSGHALPDWARDKDKTVYVKMQWKETLADMVGGYWNDTVERMRALADSPDDVRLLMFFDN